MKKIVVVLLLGIIGYYWASLHVAQKIPTYWLQCVKQVNFHARIKLAYEEYDKKILASELGECMVNKRTFFDSLFLSKKKIYDGISIK